MPRLQKGHREFNGNYSNTFSEEQLDEVAAMYKGDGKSPGMTIDAIAAHFGVSDSPVKQALVMRGSPMRIGMGRSRARTVKWICSVTGDIRLDNGDYIPAFPGRWKLGEVWRNE